MGNLWSGMTIPKNGDKVTLMSVYGYYLSTIDGLNLTQTISATEGSQFIVEFHGLDKLALRTPDGKFLSAKGKESFEFVETRDNRELFTPIYSDNRIGLKTVDEHYLSSTENFKTKQEENADETTLFSIDYVRKSLL